MAIELYQYFTCDNVTCLWPVRFISVMVMLFMANKVYHCYDESSTYLIYGKTYTATLDRQVTSMHDKFMGGILIAELKEIRQIFSAIHLGTVNLYCILCCGTRM